ncbi:MAG: proteasome subunit beta [Candidatus Diapherotrites archaeon]|uniref:Proteasome subunit beta n=1 Tax=Candidatus Iainarchaeum sp. TaxID=3101447 RepID=A0A8T4L8M2_9ARCH|nr:proteasome subunit beta [Candidatus Diapherotrites archaeon]
MESKHDLKTGTTTVGIVCKDAVVLAADMRASMGHIAYDEESEKVYKITDTMGLTNAGSVGDSQTIIRFLKGQTQLYEIEREEPMSAKAAATLLSNVLNGSRYYPFICQFLLGGYINGKPDLWEVTPYGGILQRPKYGVSGSGTEPALTTIDLGFKPNLSTEEGIKLAVRAIESGKRRDVFSGGKSVSVLVIDKSGVRILGEKEVAPIVQQVKVNL